MKIILFAFLAYLLWTGSVFGMILLKLVGLFMLILFVFRMPARLAGVRRPRDTWRGGA